MQGGVVCGKRWATGARWHGNRRRLGLSTGCRAQVHRMGRMLRVLGAEAETEGGERLGLRPRAAGTWD